VQGIPMIAIMFCCTVIILGLFGSCGSGSKPNFNEKTNLLLFYGSFDRDQDGILSIGEIVGLFEWCKSNIKYQAHSYYKSPLKTFRTKRGNCLDQALLITHCLSIFYRFPGYIGCIIIEENHKKEKHACCLLPVSRENKAQMENYLGYKISSFTVPNDRRCFVVIDPLYCDKFGKLETTDYNLREIRTLRDFPFND
jgi:hypothetical protein